MNREITPEDRKKIDEANHLIYSAWKIWRNYFHRSPQQATDLMIKAIKSHEEKDIEVIKNMPANQNPRVEE